MVINYISLLFFSIAFFSLLFAGCVENNPNIKVEDFVIDYSPTGNLLEYLYIADFTVNNTNNITYTDITIKFTLNEWGGGKVQKEIYIDALRPFEKRQNNFSFIENAPMKRYKHECTVTSQMPN